MSELKILKASAGSGKTHRLTQEYIALLFDNPYNYRHILAVTFTNKASEEMKTRILQELDILANDMNSDYEEFLLKRFNFKKDELRKNASTALNLILHDYSRFSVITIDSFFQKCIKSFIKELGIFSNFNIEFDSNKILGESVDELLNSIGENKELKSWVIQFSEDKINEGKSWNLKSSIVDLGKEIFKEEFSGFSQEFKDQLSDKSFLNNYLKSTRKILENLKKEYSSFGMNGLNMIEKQSLSTDDFSGKSKGFINYLNKIKSGFLPPTDTNRKIQDDVDKWYTKTSTKKDEIISIYNSGLHNIFTSAITFYDKNFKVYLTADKIRKYLFALGILIDLSEKLKEYSKDKNLFLISETNKLLNGIIGKSDAPFIYEKIGNYFSHFMIDEFQDTSGLQWDNFKPLITESLSKGNLSLVVGDTKQSIYRWRNGDWKLLAYKLEQDFINLGTNTNSLKENWRSYPNIIRFNNLFFKQAAEILQDNFNNDLDGVPDDKKSNYQSIIKNVYTDVEQDIPNKKRKKDFNGYVNIKLFDKDIFVESSLKSMISAIEELQDNGYNASDIAIIVRKNDEGKKIADYIFEYKDSNEAKPERYNYNVISNDSLFLKNSSAIVLIINVLYHLQLPDERIYKALIIENYLDITSGKESKSDLDLSFLSDKDDKFYSFLPPEFETQSKKLIHLPLFEKIESIIRIFKLNKSAKSIPYLKAFQDMVYEFGFKESHDTTRFLSLWDDKQDKKTLELSDSQDAIQIITIHKSKGLQFKTVIIPFCNWKMGSGGYLSPVLWCKPETSPFNKLEFVPVKFQKDLKDSEFYDEFITEKIHGIIDNINLLYVAFTRAKDVIYAFSSHKDEINNESISDLMQTFLTTSRNTSIINEETTINDLWNNNDLEFKYGEFPEKISHTKATLKTDSTGYFSESIIGRIKIKSDISTYFTNELPEWHSAKDKGTILHKLFSKIETIDDIDKAVEDLVYEGHINTNEGKNLRKEIKSQIEKPEIRDWFSDNWKVITEEKILFSGGKIKIPDRIMISGDNVVIVDYKFGGNESESHKNQVRSYSALLTEMGYMNIKSYLWYYTLGKVVCVD